MSSNLPLKLARYRTNTLLEDFSGLILDEDLAESGLSLSDINSAIKLEHWEALLRTRAYLVLLLEPSLAKHFFETDFR